MDVKHRCRTDKTDYNFMTFVTIFIHCHHFLCISKNNKISLEKGLISQCPTPFTVYGRKRSCELMSLDEASGPKVRAM